MHLQPGARVVIVDPGHSSHSGHHAELNRQLLAACQRANLAVECWVDQSLQEQDPSYRRVFQGCGYVDPRHWLDLAGSLHLASRFRDQLQSLQAGEPVAGWIAHSLLPFQLIGLAQLLQNQPAAQLEIGVLYSPGERLGGSSEASAISPGVERERELAIANTRVAWNALAQAVDRAGHQLRLGCSSQLQANLHRPLVAAAGLPPLQQQPAVVGMPSTTPPITATAHGEAHAPQILLHWGDLKAGKGRHQVFALVEALLRGSAYPTPPRRWLFHHCSESSLSASEHHCLAKAKQDLPDFVLWEGHASSEAMQSHLAQTSVALLPYCPNAYAERSSGVLWCYAAARLAAGRSAQVLGYAGGWLAHEASALGIGWLSLPSHATTPLAWMDSIDRALAFAQSAPSITPYGQQVLCQSYAHWLFPDVPAPFSEGAPS
jgi:hypothetical protein